MKNIMAFGAFALSALLLSSCMVDEASEHNSATPLEGEGSTAKYLFKIGQSESIVLPGSPGTGYSWSLAKPSKFCKVNISSQKVKGTALVGAPTNETVTIQAVDMGEETIVLVYKRPWENNVETSDKYQIHVTVMK